MAFKNRKRRKTLATSFVSSRLFLFALAFGITGGVFLLISTRAAIVYAPYPPHYSTCIENTPSKTAVKPGENFSAVIRLRNDGSSVWSPSYGFYLGEFRDGAGIWNPTGTSLSGSVFPGATKQFNIGVKAPAQQGTYTFDWGMVIVYNGYVQNPCRNKTVAVMNSPTVKLLLNGQNSDITLKKGSSLKLNWLSGQNITSCKASGAWSGSKPAAGSETRTADTSSTGSKTYRISCSNAVGSNSISRTVKVTAPTTSTGTSGGSGGGTAEPTTSSGGSPKGGTSSPTSDADTSDPSTPGDFTAEAMTDSTVQLRWTASTDNLAVKGYQIDRSTDKVKWKNISGSELLTDETMADTEAVYQTRYFYRVRARDEAGNYSKYATTEVTTNAFEANTSLDKETVLSSDDGIITVVIPAGAAGVAQCSLRADNSVLPPEKDGYETLAGPYQVSCKDTKSEVIASFSSPLTVSVALNENQKKDHRVLAYMVHTGESWEEVDSTPTDSLKSFEVSDNSSFAVMADAQSTPLWKTILKVLAFTGFVISGLLLAVNFYLRQKQKRAVERQYQDYYHKERGY